MMMSSLWGKKSALGVRGQNFKPAWAVGDNRPYQNKILKFLRAPGGAQVLEKYAKFHELLQTEQR